MSVPENSAGTIYTATAADAEGDPLTYTISGGEDAALFQITPSGQVSFRTPPDFEIPTDKFSDNELTVQLTVNDPAHLGEGITVVVTVTDVTTGPFHVRRVTNALTQPVYVTGIPDASGRVLVVQKTGQVRIVTPATGAIATTPFLDVSSEVSTDGSRGLLSLALAPDFTTSGQAYVFLTNLAGDVEIRRYTTFAGDRNRLDPATADVIMKIQHSASNTNIGGWLGFNPEDRDQFTGGQAARYLYITSGDGDDCGGPLDLNTILNCNVIHSDRMLGMVIRIDPRSDSYPADPDRDYAVPVTNHVDEIQLLHGLRNPYRASFDSKKPREFWIGDIGQGLREEIDREIVSFDYRLQNGRTDFGWPYMEGNFENVFDTRVRNTRPVYDYTHGTGDYQGGAVVGGYVYRGPAESLQGLYIFGDYVTGHIFSGKFREAFLSRTADFKPDVGTIDHISSFGEDQSSNLYIVDFDGELFVVEPG